MGISNSNLPQVIELSHPEEAQKLMKQKPPVFGTHFLRRLLIKSPNQQLDMINRHHSSLFLAFLGHSVSCSLNTPFLHCLNNTRTNHSLLISNSAIYYLILFLLYFSYY